MKVTKSHTPTLRCGFSTGTAATAAAMAALRHLITGAAADSVAVKLPSGAFLEVPVASSSVSAGTASALIIKDGGDDPDITNGAEIRAKVSVLYKGSDRNRRMEHVRPGILLVAVNGVGIVTKPGLPVAPGEPAINPTPRKMLAENVTLELLRSHDFDLKAHCLKDLAILESQSARAHKPTLHLPFFEETGSDRNLLPVSNFSVIVEIEIPRGEELSRHTLNPRLGITGGISILGTTGIVKPFSNEAYEQTIQAALSVAASNACNTIVLSTGGKSERFASNLLSELPPESFVQIADFFSFAVRQARSFDFSGIIHSVFFGKAVKMAQGHPYTHAHSVPMDLDFLGDLAYTLGHDVAQCRELASANTARHALEIISARGLLDIVESVAKSAAAQSARIAGDGMRIRLLLFDYEGRLLADVMARHDGYS